GGAWAAARVTTLVRPSGARPRSRASRARADARAAAPRSASTTHLHRAQGDHAGGAARQQGLGDASAHRGRVAGGPLAVLAQHLAPVLAEHERVLDDARVEVARVRG